MNLVFNITINTYSIILLVIIGIYHLQNDDKKTLQYRLFSLLVGVNIFLLVFDILGRFDGNLGTIYPFINHFGNFVLFMVMPILPCVWFLYVHHQIYRDERKTVKLIIPLALINLINFVILIMSQFKNYYYYIDSDNIYHRGPFYFIVAIIMSALLLTIVLLVVLNRRRLSRKQYIALLIFPFFPFISILLQTYVYGLSLQVNSTAISIIMIFLNIQKDQIYTDYLTGLGNRKRLDDYFRRQIVYVSKERKLAAIMLDVDNFKIINDTYGHKTGDLVLQDTAKILNLSVLDKHAIATRYGGDEFCIIINDCNEEKLKNIVNAIQNNVVNFNQSNDYPYVLSLSMGYSTFEDPAIEMKSFFEKIDQLMYQNKKNK